MDIPSLGKPSLLDRLLDDFPEEQNPRDPDIAMEERRRNTWESWRESLRRDLSMLLSTRLSAWIADAARPQVAKSVAGYGVVSTPSAHGRASVPAAILKAVSIFEPRFRDPQPLPGNSKDEPSLICALTGWVEWGGYRRDVVAKVFSEGDGWKVELYE